MAVSDDDGGGSAEVDGNVGIVGIASKPSEAKVDDAMGEVRGPEGVAVVATPPGTKPGRKFAISRRGGMTGGKRYNLHQLILPDASILPESKVGDRGGLFNTGLEACLAEWKSRKLNTNDLVKFVARKGNEEKAYRHRRTLLRPQNPNLCRRLLINQALRIYQNRH